MEIQTKRMNAGDCEIKESKLPNGVCQKPSKSIGIWPQFNVGGFYNAGIVPSLSFNPAAQLFFYNSEVPPHSARFQNTWALGLGGQGFIGENRLTAAAGIYARYSLASYIFRIHFDAGIYAGGGAFRVFSSEKAFASDYGFGGLDLVAGLNANHFGVYLGGGGQIESLPNIKNKEGQVLLQGGLNFSPNVKAGISFP